ncbi:MAG: DNA polymerase III subunit delta [Acholeplasma sp.]|nr:DNA polymerase III subunit delta [Acholeplasma sp.]
MPELINVIYGKNDFLVKERLKVMIETSEVDSININHYDLVETNNLDVLEDLRTVSFFSEQKVIVIENIEELLKEDETIMNGWIKYLDKPNPDVFLFIVLRELINENTLLGKTLFKRALIEEVKELEKDDFNNYLVQYLKSKNYSIDKDALKELIIRTNKDLNLIMQELEKLMLYNFDSLYIGIDSVNQLVSRNLEENIYELTNNLLSSNGNKTIEIYYDLLARNEDPLRIMINIGNKIRELIHTKLLLEKGYNQDDIEKHFNIKSGVAYYLIKMANKVSLSRLEEYLDKLTKLDYEIKSGRVDKKLGLEIFILGA